MTGSVVRVQRRSIGWQRFRAICGCKQLRTAWINETEAWTAAEKHAFDTGHELWATVISGVL